MKVKTLVMRIPAHNLRAPAPGLHPLCRHIPNDHPHHPGPSLRAQVQRMACAGLVVGGSRSH
jgi:hypothetical protein